MDYLVFFCVCVCVCACFSFYMDGVLVSMGVLFVPFQCVCGRVLFSWMSFFFFFFSIVCLIFRWFFFLPLLDYFSFICCPVDVFHLRH